MKNSHHKEEAMIKDRTLIDLRAELARRVEDRRIARKHMDAAAERVWTLATYHVYQRCSAWFDRCSDCEADAREQLIRYSLSH